MLPMSVCHCISRCADATALRTAAAPPGWTLSPSRRARLPRRAIWLVLHRLPWASEPWATGPGLELVPALPRLGAVAAARAAGGQGVARVVLHRRWRWVRSR